MLLPMKATYTKEKTGIMPELVIKMYNERVRYKKQMLHYKQKLVDIESEMKKRGLKLMLLTASDAVWAADEFINYYRNFNRIDDYFRMIKADRLVDTAGSLFGPEDDIFSDFVYIHQR